MAVETSLAEALERARALARRAEDEDAKLAYVDVLRQDPTNFFALIELAALALAGGYRSAARTAYLQAVQHHPDNKIARVNLANVLREENDLPGAKQHYLVALSIDPDLHEAHQGMAWVLKEQHLEGAEEHWRRGYSGHALVTRPYRGTRVGVPLLLLVSARGGAGHQSAGPGARHRTRRQCAPPGGDTGCDFAQDRGLVAHGACGGRRS